MTPKEYLDLYTYLEVENPLTLRTESAGVTAYGSYWGSRKYPGQGNKSFPADPVKKEYEIFTAALRMAHHGNTKTPCGERFVFDQVPLGWIFPTEEFYAVTIFNAFLGKGSPDEITDTLRLAMAIGRIKLEGTDVAGAPRAFPTAQQYADRFMTLDCNGLVRNFCGAAVNDIKYYAAKERRRLDPTRVQIGDVVVTHCNLHPYEHIGLIDGWQVKPGNLAEVSVAEWGKAGDEDAHYSTFTVPIARSFEDQVGVGWTTTSNLAGNPPTYRSIFTRPVMNDPLGWS